MKKLLFYLMLLIGLNSYSQWNLATNFPSTGIASPFCFTITGKAYIGTGYDDSFTPTVSNYEYNPITNSWLTKSVPPFLARVGAFSFSIGNFGYVGSGIDYFNNLNHNDFWKYNPVTDNWSQMANFPGIPRIRASTFVLNGKGYVIAGCNGSGDLLNDCWEYNPLTNVWTQMAIPPTLFTGGYVTGFVSGNFIYVGLGGNNVFSTNDFWKFDTILNLWVQLPSLPSTPQARNRSVGGIDLISGKGYVGLGYSPVNFSYPNDFWNFDFGTGTWESTPTLYNFPVGLSNSINFNLNGYVYVGTGFLNPDQITNKIYKIQTTVIPIFTQIEPICSGETLQSLPLTSQNNITGTWSPTINNTTTTTYTFTPNGGQSATTATMTIVVNPVNIITTTATACGSYTWAKNGVTYTTSGTYTILVGACGSEVLNLTIIPAVIPTFTQIAPICSGETLFALPTTSNGISGTWSPTLNNLATRTYTFTPNAGQCATTATMTIVVNPNVLPTFTQVAPICFGTALSALPTVSAGITGTWSPELNNLATTTYSFTPNAGQCATTATMTIVVYLPNIEPNFNQVAPICFGSILDPLPTTSNSSNNPITGTWSPALNNTATTTYTFTPNIGQCAKTKTMTIVVNPQIIPTFTQISPICSGQTLSALPTTSNGITGTWSPALNNLATTTYTFTPNAGQCATTAMMTIVVNSPTTPTFTQIGPLCQGSTGVLPISSNEGKTGTWSPSIIDTSVEGTFLYTFIPNVGLCTTTTIMTIIINPSKIPTFDTVGPICLGAAISPLPTTFLTDNITGTWSPAINNLATTTYTFTPDAGQCATTTTMTIVVKPNETFRMCGTTLTSINELIVGPPSGYPTSSVCGYRFMITKLINGLLSTNSADIQISPIRTYNNFAITQFPRYAYNTCYSVQTSVCVNGVWQPYSGECCTICTPTKLTKVVNSQCGTTLICINEKISADYVSFIKDVPAPQLPWRFKITNLSNQSIQIVDKQLRDFYMSDLGSCVATYDTTYKIEVAFLNTDDTWSNYGQECFITTPPFPTTRIRSSDCNRVITNRNQNIYADLIPCAMVNKYRFRLTNAAGYSQTVDSMLGVFRLNQFAGLLPNTPYYIEVSVEICGVFGPFGPTCGLSTLRSAPIKDKEISTEFNVASYPNPFSETTTIKVESSNDEPIQIFVYDMIGKLIEVKTIESSNSEIEIGSQFSAGVYNVIVNQGFNTKNIKIIKR